MHRIDQPTAVNTLPTPAAAGTPGYFSNATPGSGTPTIVDNDWCNDIQEELISILTAASVSPSKTTHNQVLTSLQALFAPITGGRTKLSGSADYYVATTGNDSNNGSSGSPWLTLQHAWNWIIQNIDTGGYSVTIHVADGTYGAGLTVSAPLVGGTTPTIVGNTTTPANCIISTTSQSCFNVFNAPVTIGGFKVTSTGNHGVSVSGSGVVSINNAMEYGACTSGNHLYCQNPGSAIEISSGGYKITGGALAHYASGFGATQIFVAGQTVTLSGSLSFSNAFANITDLCLLNCGGITFSGGTITGKRFAVVNNGVINTGGGGANYFPGNSAGTGTNSGTSPYGLYI